jgi:hypothetical protein
VAETIISMKISSDIIGNRTRDLLVFKGSASTNCTTALMTNLNYSFTHHSPISAFGTFPGFDSLSFW